MKVFQNYYNCQYQLQNLNTPKNTIGVKKPKQFETLELVKIQPKLSKF
jgi:hypothetical protein